MGPIGLNNTCAAQLKHVDTCMHMVAYMDYMDNRRTTAVDLCRHPLIGNCQKPL